MNKAHYHSLAEQSIKNVRYLLTRTYPAIKERKLLFTIVQHINKALRAEVEAILNHELNIQAPESQKIGIFENYCLKRGITTEAIQVVRKTEQLLSEHKRSAVVFSRQESLVLCQQDTSYSMIEEGKLHSWLRAAEEIVMKLSPNNT